MTNKKKELSKEEVAKLAENTAKKEVAEIAEIVISSINVSGRAKYLINRLCKKYPDKVESLRKAINEKISSLFPKKKK